MTLPLDMETLTRILAEDVGAGDVTSAALLPPDLTATLSMRTRQPLVVAGLEIAAAVFRLCTEAKVTLLAEEGQSVAAGEALMTVSGPAAGLLTAERTALNLLQRASAVATLTRAYVDAVEGTGAIILDTRKTMPGLRNLDKYAVRMGGGQNHRMRLDDMILIKDNHIALAGGISAALACAAKANAAHLPIVIECDGLDQLAEVLAYAREHPSQVMRALLDNMDNTTLREAVRMSHGLLPLEASGNMTLERVRGVAETGVQYISVGRITHSAPNVDIGLDIAFG